MLVVVGVPSYDGKPNYQTVDSLLAEQFVCREEGVYILVEWLVGLPYVAIARNQLIERFLSIKEADQIIMVDADVSWPAGTLLKLARRQEDIVGGTYRPKQDKLRFHVDDVEHKPEKHGDVWKVDGIPGGFMKISRKAAERMKPQASPYYDFAKRVWRDYFKVGWANTSVGPRYFQEDYGFCWFWRQLGGEVWLDPTLRVRHHQGVYVFDGDANQWMDETYGAAGGSRTEPQETPGLDRKAE